MEVIIMSNHPKKTAETVETTVARIPLHWAVSILVLLILPLSVFLGAWNFALWASFIVWTQFFLYGAKFDTWKIIFPCIPYGALIGFIWSAASYALEVAIPALGGGFWGFFLTTPIIITAYVWSLGKVPVWRDHTLSVFNGFSLYLAIYFTGSIPYVGPMANTYWVTFLAFLWTVAMCYFGWFCGWVNILLTFPKKVRVPK